MDTWLPHLRKRLSDDYFLKLRAFIDMAYQKEIVYPPKAAIFRAFELTAYEDTRVVLLGQDPYHGSGQAQGLSFSVPNQQKTPPSLMNILKELENDIGKRHQQDLTRWAKQGVLLLNSCLTVPKAKPNGHAGLIWETLTDEVIRLLNEAANPIVFILWGSYARKKKVLISQHNHLVLESPHPSPLSAYRGFFGSRPFSKTNAFLIKNKQEPIDWLT